MQQFDRHDSSPLQSFNGVIPDVEEVETPTQVCALCDTVRQIRHETVILRKEIRPIDRKPIACVIYHSSGGFHRQADSIQP